MRLRLCNNLIDNAIRYSKTEGIIYIKLNTSDDNISLSIEDNGDGDPDNYAKIFQRFSGCARHRRKWTRFKYC